MIRRKLLLLLLILVPFSLAAGAEKPRLDIVDLLRIKTLSDVAISPDGKRVAFSVTEPDFKQSKMVSHIWVAPVEGGEARQFTYSKEGERRPQWSPDGRWLAFLSARGAAEAEAVVEEDEDGTAAGKNQVWIMPSEGGEAWQLTEADMGVMDFQWMPDSKSIAFLAPEPHPTPIKELKERDKKRKVDAVVEDEEKHRKQIWTIAISDKKTRRIYDGDFGVAEIRVSPDGKTIAFATNYTGKEDDDKKFDIWAVSVEDSRAWQVTRRPGGERSPRWSPDGKRIAFRANLDPEISYSQEEIFIVAAGGGEPENLTAAFDQGIGEIIWHEKDGHLYFSADSRTYNHIYRMALPDREIKRITREDRVWASFDIARGGALAAAVEDSRSAPELWYTREWQAPEAGRVLTSLNSFLSNFQIAEQEVTAWKGADGWEIEGVLVKPLGYQPGRRYPLLLALHGGPYGRTMNALRQYYHYQYWAAHGYAVLSPNYRGSSGYGNAFGIANRADLGGKDFVDIMAGVEHLIEIGLADPERLGVFGGSYGGYLTNWIISQTDRFKAAVSLFGIFNLITDFSNSHLPSWEPEYLAAYYWENLDIYLKRSPFTYVKNIKTPVLIIHGEADTNTFISNSKEMYQALRTLGRTVEFVRYPREGHGLREPNHRIDEMRRMLAWFDKYLKGEKPGLPAEYRIGIPVAHGNWELTVISAERSERYLGRKPEGSFLEVNFILKSRDGAAGPLGLNITGAPGDIALLDSAGREYRPVGVPVQLLGEKLLVSGRAQSISAAPDQEQKELTVPVAIAFDVPRDQREFKLRIKDFPAISIYIPGEPQK